MSDEYSQDASRAEATPRRRVLVAGIGNVFLGDDGFGVAVAERLRGEPLGAHVDVADFGIRAIHLAYELADGRYDAAVLVDAVSRGGPPGTLYTLEPDVNGEAAVDLSDAHALTPDGVLAWLKRMGTNCRIIIVGCEPGALEDAMGLSDPVAGSIDAAVQLVREIVADLSGVVPCA